MPDFAVTDEEREKIRIRARARARSGFYDAPKTTPKELIQRWNKGLVDLIAAPTDLINAGLRLATDVTTPPYARGANVEPFQIPTIGPAERQLLADRGYIPSPSDPASGALEHGMEILGAGTLPHIAMSTRGSQILNQSIRQMERMGVLDNLAAGTMRSPVATAAGEAAASGGSGLGRSIAEENNASMPMVVMAELFGGLAPSAFIGVAGRVSTLRYVSNALKKHVLPFTKEGAWPRAAKRVRDLAADPQASATRIDDESPISPARQTGDERLLALERSVLKENPDLDTDFATALAKAKEDLKAEVLDFFGGDKARPRVLLTKGKQYLIALLDARSAQAAADVEGRLSGLDPNASPREINRRVRSVIDDAYADARATEKVLWESLDSDAAVSLARAKGVLRDEIAQRGRFDDPDDIPGFVRTAFGGKELPPALRSQLDRAGLLDRDGNTLPGVRERLVSEGVLQDSSYTFNDARTIRSRILREIRAEQAKDAPNRNKIRILDEIATGILDDIGNSGVEGAAAAREFSARLNDRFTRGQVGRLLGHDRSGAERITEASTLDALLAGRDPGASIRQVIDAAPASRPIIEDYLKAEFIGQTNAGQSRRATERFIDKWERLGAFEAFPGLRGDLKRFSSAQEAAERLGVRADRVRSWANKSGKSTAALYLNQDPGDEIRAVLNSQRPAANARKLRAKMRGDIDAEAGLRTAYLEEGFRSSQSGVFHPDGTPVYSGRRFTEYLSRTRPVARSLGVTDAERSRLEGIALRMRQIEAKPGESVGAPIQDTPAAIMDLVARYIGAQQGGRLGQDMGSSLVLSQAFSRRVVGQLERLTRNTATHLLIEAHKDPKLYRALLLNTNAPKPKQEKAARAIESWLVGVGVTQDQED